MQHIGKFVRALALLLALCLTVPGAMAQSNSDEDLDARYREKYGYVDVEGKHTETCLSYLGFSRFLARDAGEADGMLYTLHGSVSEENVADYLVYLQRFGYVVTLDATQNGTRSIELRNNDTPKYLPKVYRIDYSAADQAILTVEPLSCNRAYMEYTDQEAQDFACDIGNEKESFLANVTMTLSGVMVTPSYAILGGNEQGPFHPEAATSLMDHLVKRPLQVTQSPSGEPVSVIRAPEEAYWSDQQFWLLRLVIDNQGEDFDLSDLEFCIAADETIVSFPWQMGTAITDGGEWPILNTALPETMLGHHVIWLAFPSLGRASEYTLKLYVSNASWHKVLPYWFGFGFQINEQMIQEPIVLDN